VEKLLSTNAACESLGICRATLYKLVSRGAIRAHFIAKAWKFKPADLEAYLDKMAVGR
jgi:excisionase family DNA binding protein